MYSSTFVLGFFWKGAAAAAGPHHPRFERPLGLGLKESDEFTVPLCRGHHRQLHQAGNEAWREDLDIDALEIAKGLWDEPHARTTAAHNPASESPPATNLPGKANDYCKANHRKPGPKSARGKMRARQNAFRHGLTAETVITTLENVGEYTAFESVVVADYRPKNNVERMLAVRLASLLWRLRHTVAVETGPFQAQRRCAKPACTIIFPPLFGGPALPPSSVLKKMRAMRTGI
jgi:hypothetical protein